MERPKMPRQQRAKIFAPFTVMGLQEAIALKDYEHEKVVLNEMSEEKAKEISDTLANIIRGEFVYVKYYFDGYTQEVAGSIKLCLLENFIMVGNTKILLDNLLDIRKDIFDKI